MIGIIYKTTCLINNKVYIGQHSGIDENYFGSGNLIIKAIKKYGKENFTRETLRECNTQKELDAFEQIYIKRFNSTDGEIGYNILPGTANGFGHVNPATLPCVKEKIKNDIVRRGGLCGKNNPMYGKKWSADKRKQMEDMFENNHPFKNKKHSEITKQNWSNKRKGKDPFANISIEKRININKKLAGKNNPMYGSTFTWINNGISNKRQPLDSAIPEGYVLGLLKRI